MRASFSRYGVVSLSKAFLFIGLLFALRLGGNHKKSPVTETPADGSSNNLLN
jgi:hypothetical protein